MTALGPFINEPGSCQHRHHLSLREFNMNDQIDQGNTQTTNPTNSSFPSMKRAAVKGKARTKKQVAISLLR